MLQCSIFLLVLHIKRSVSSRLWFFQWPCMHVRVGLWRKLSAKNWCFWTVVLEKTLESPLDCKEIQQVHPEGDQSWVFIGRTDAEAEIPILWPPDAKSCLIWKDPDAGTDRGQEEKGTTEDKMIGWHHQLSGHGFGWTLGAVDGQGGLVCCNWWGRKESDTTERLNWTDIMLCFPGGSDGKNNLPAIQEAWVQSLGWEYPLEKGMAPHSSNLAWRVPWIKEPVRLQSMEWQRVGHDWTTNTYILY